MSRLSCKLAVGTTSQAFRLQAAASAFVTGPRYRALQALFAVSNDLPQAVHTHVLSELWYAKAPCGDLAEGPKGAAYNVTNPPDMSAIIAWTVFTSPT